MADEPKAPRKRAAKKAVEGESKKVSKKAAAIPVPLFQAAPNKSLLCRQIANALIKKSI